MKSSLWKSGVVQTALLGTGTWMLGAMPGVSFGQEAQPLRVRLRAVATEDGKVEIVNEDIEGGEEKAEKKDEEQPAGERKTRVLRDAIVKVYQKALAADAADGFPEDAVAPQSDYWIGVQLAPVPTEVQKHLPIKHGIMVQLVYPESPAEKAELKVDDILLQADEIVINQAEDLVKAVDTAKDKELKLVLLREGKEARIVVTPVKRAEEKASTEVEAAKSNLARLERLKSAQQQFEKALEALRAETAAEPEKRAIDFMLVRPGAFMYQNTTIAKPKLPEGVTMQVTIEGDKPAKIRVTRGEKSWDATPETLEALPEDLRGPVQQVLGHGAGMINVAPYLNYSQANELATPPYVTLGAAVAGEAPTMAQYKVFNPAQGVIGVPGAPTGPVAPGVPGVAVFGGVPAHTPIPAAPLAPAAVKAARAAIVAQAQTAPSAPMATMSRQPLAWSVQTPPGALEAKMDLVIKKLDSLGSRDLEQMKKELQTLRKEVDRLTKEKLAEPKE